jgi:hypothetical protein
VHTNELGCRLTLRDSEVPQTVASNVPIQDSQHVTGSESGNCMNLDIVTVLPHWLEEMRLTR